MSRVSVAGKMDYICIRFILNATEYGVPQKRERVFFIGIKYNQDPFFEYNMNNFLGEEKQIATKIKEVLKTIRPAGTELNPITSTAKITFATRPVMRKSSYAGMYFNEQGRPIDINGYANTLPVSMGGNKAPFVDEECLYDEAEEHWVVGCHRDLQNGLINTEFKEAPARLRRITKKEAARIQTFPDDYIFCGSNGKVYTQIGNAVPCKIAKAVARATIKYLEESTGTTERKNQSYGGALVDLKIRV